MAKIKINNERCKGCGLCVINCPRHLITLTGPVNKLGVKIAKHKSSRDCTGCTLCAIVCPDSAIEVWK